MEDKDITYYDYIQEGVYKILRESGWGVRLKRYLMSKDFESIIKQLMDEVDNDHRFTPRIKEALTAFVKCPLDKVKLVIVGSEPSEYINDNDGLAFSCSKQTRMSKELDGLYHAIKSYIPSVVPNKDLSHWAEQGILLLNPSLTTRINNKGHHYKIWQPFMEHIFDLLRSSNCCYVFIGEHAKQFYDESIDSRCFVYKSVEEFNPRLINTMLYNQQLGEIVW